MKIAFFTDSFFPLTNGVTVSVMDYATQLSRLGHSVVIFAPKPEAKYFLPRFRDFKVEWLPSVRSFYPDLRIGAPTPRSFLKLRRFNPDLIHVFTPLLIGGEGVVGARLLKKPWFFSFATYYMTAEGQKGFGLHRHSQIIEKGLWQFTKSFCKSCQMIIAPTDSVAKDLKQQKFTNRISVLPAGIDLSLVERNGQRKKTLKEQLDLKGLIILGVGRISREKDWELLLGAMARLYMRKKRYTLVLIGKGPYEDELRFLARTLGIEHRVRFLGEIPHQDLIKDGYYQIGDVFAMPSSFETQGLVTLEAMAFGLPIVGVKAAGTVDLIKSTGLFSKKSEEDLADKLNQILEDVSLRHRLSKQSLLKANDFGLDKIVVQLEAVYLNLLRKSEA